MEIPEPKADKRTASPLKNDEQDFESRRADLLKKTKGIPLTEDEIKITINALIATENDHLD